VSEMIVRITITLNTLRCQKIAKVGQQARFFPGLHAIFIKIL